MTFEEEQCRLWSWEWQAGIWSDILVGCPEVLTPVAQPSGQSTGFLLCDPCSSLPCRCKQREAVGVADELGAPRPLPPYPFSLLQPRVFVSRLPWALLLAGFNQWEPWTRAEGLARREVRLFSPHPTRPPRPLQLCLSPRVAPAPAGPLSLSLEILPGGPGAGLLLLVSARLAAIVASCCCWGEGCLIISIWLLSPSLTHVTTSLHQIPSSWKIYNGPWLDPALRGHTRWPVV